MDISESSKLQFRKSLGDVRLIIERIPIKDLRNFSRLVDLTLQLDVTYAFNAIHDLRQKENNELDLYRRDILESGSGYVTPERRGSPFSHDPMISGQFAFDVCYQQTHTNTSSPTGSVSAAAVTNKQEHRTSRLYI